MKKYFVLSLIHLKLIASYRFEIVFGWTYRFLQLYVYYIFWSLTTNNPQELNRLFMYFLLYYSIIEPISTGKVASQMSKSILRGEITTFLTKPVYYPFVQFTVLVRILVVRLIGPTILLTILGIFNSKDFAPSSILNLILFIVFCLLGIILWNLIILNIACFSFWGTEITGFLTLFDLVLRVFKGGLIPIFLFPLWLTDILTFTPIPYLASTAVEIYQSDLNTNYILKSFLIAITWIIIFGVLFKKFYKYGLSRYEAH
jgi:ABC-2 type transport system permease protein